jgi:hypothetical protein
VDIKWIRNGERKKKGPELATWHMVFLELRNLSEVFVPHTFLQAWIRNGERKKKGPELG